jgi:hypothetical protein
MATPRKAPYMHRDGSDCYTKNCSIDHAVTIEEQNKAIYEDFNKRLADLEAERDSKLAEYDISPEPVMPVLATSKEMSQGLNSFCENYPAPCNCKEEAEPGKIYTHDGAIYYYTQIDEPLIHKLDAQGSPITDVNSFNVQHGYVADEVVVGHVLYSRRRPGVFPSSPYSMRIQANRELQEGEARKLAGLVGYVYRTTIAGERLSEPGIDSPFSFTVGADTTKSARDDLGEGFLQFEESLRDTIQDGSPLRKTDKAGVGTKAPVSLTGSGLTLK